jgi:hypothetical protein
MFYLGDAPPNNLSEWADEIAQIAGRRKPLAVPFWLVKAAALFGDMLGLAGVAFPMTSFRLGNMTTDSVMDLSNTYHAAPNLPFSRQQGIKITLDWLATQKQI